MRNASTFTETNMCSVNEASATIVKSCYRRQTSTTRRTPASKQPHNESDHSENENELQLPPIAPRRFILGMRGECVCMLCIISTLSPLRKVTKYCKPGSRPLSCWPIDTYGYTRHHPLLCARVVFLDVFNTSA